ncbi:hypothetical protein HZY97_16165 [Sphingomonas sp. R-74633]|uniref:hypothetical protein n=1 Tax=Sphingomonas sp. R-74633 TaxID=2751188 RepID=UPI0015D4294B|nr:hypothetical protein [Sphingomonas sp. R-74633]NYT42308.1 hypothetical protein [Sphingomonas sp. R-74633]
MTEHPIFWQRGLAEIYTPDGGDTFHIRETINGKTRERAMSRATYIGQLMIAIEALAGPGGVEDLELLGARIARHGDNNR